MAPCRRSSKSVGVFVYGSPSLHYVELSTKSLGYELYAEIEDLEGIPVGLQLLVYKGKLVHPAIPLLSQGFTNGCSVFVATLSKGGGKDDPTKIPIGHLMEILPHPTM